MIIFINMNNIIILFIDFIYDFFVYLNWLRLYDMNTKVVCTMYVWYKRDSTIEKQSPC